MTLRQFDHPLDALIDSLGMFADSSGHDGDTLREAAEVVRAMTASGKLRPPTVVITSGWDMDPLIGEVEELQVAVGNARGELGAISDRVDEVLDTLRRRIGDRDGQPQRVVTT